MQNQDKDFRKFREAIRGTRIIKLPNRKIATFGNTLYTYYVLCPSKDNSTIIHEGNLNVKTPLLVQPFSNESPIQGFEKDVSENAEKVMNEMGLNPMMLEYQFQHSPREKWEENRPLYIVVNDVKGRTEKDTLSLIICGEEKTWPTSLIKACLKLIRQSLPLNLREFEERGLLSDEGIPSSVYSEIEKLFNEAREDHAKIDILGNLLVRHNLFEKFEDRFFSLYKKN